MIAHARFGLIGIDADGILLDCRSANIYQLNESGMDIWRWRLDGASDEDILELLQTTRGLSQSQSVMALEAMAVPQNPPAADGLMQGALQWSLAEEAQISVKLGETRIAAIFPLERQLVLHEAVGPVERALLRSFAPRILALHGFHVLHASAVALDDGTLAVFSGPSGAGKTTTAHILEEASLGRCVSEDMLVLPASTNDASTARVSAVSDGEAHILSWVDRNQGASHSRQRVGYQDLLEAVAHSKAWCPLGEVFFLEDRNPPEAGWTATPAAQVNAAAQWIRQSFVGSPDPARWQKLLAMIVANSRKTASAFLRVPHGREAARDTASGYNWMRTA